MTLLDMEDNVSNIGRKQTISFQSYDVKDSMFKYMEQMNVPISPLNRLEV